VTFVAMPGVDGIRSFRALLKVALRRYGLRAIDVREHSARNEDERARSSFSPPAPLSHPSPPRSTREIPMSAYSDRIRGQKTGVFKVADFAGGREETLTIDYLEEKVEMFDKTVDLLHFVETKQTLAVNQTNAEFLLNALGDDPQKWKGQRVVLYLVEYTYGDERGYTIRIKLRDAKPGAVPLEQTQARSPNPKGDRSKPDFDDSIPF
jgi:hypothetical protein